MLHRCESIGLYEYAIIWSQYSIPLFKGPMDTCGTGAQGVFIYPDGRHYKPCFAHSVELCRFNYTVQIVFNSYAMIHFGQT